jgi:hypothetical protein
MKIKKFGLVLLVIGVGAEVIAARGGGHGGVPRHREGVSRPSRDIGFHGAPRAGFRPTRGVRGISTRGLGLTGRRGFARRPGAHLNPLRMSRATMRKHNLTQRHFNQQKHFFTRGRAFGGHRWNWWFRRNLAFFYSFFPFLFYNAYGYYPPIYYSYFDTYGYYPTPYYEVPEYNQYYSIAQNYSVEAPVEQEGPIVGEVSLDDDIQTDNDIEYGQ